MDSRTHGKMAAPGGLLRWPRRGTAIGSCAGFLCTMAISNVPCVVHASMSVSRRNTEHPCVHVLLPLQVLQHVPTVPESVVQQASECAAPDHTQIHLRWPRGGGWLCDGLTAKCSEGHVQLVEGVRSRVMSTALQATSPGQASRISAHRRWEPVHLYEAAIFVMRGCC